MTDTQAIEKTKWDFTWKESLEEMIFELDLKKEDLIELRKVVDEKLSEL